MSTFDVRWRRLAREAARAVKPLPAVPVETVLRARRVRLSGDTGETRPWWPLSLPARVAAATLALAYAVAIPLSAEAFETFATLEVSLSDVPRLPALPPLAIPAPPKAPSPSTLVPYLPAAPSAASPEPRP